MMFRSPTSFIDKQVKRNVLTTKKSEHAISNIKITRNTINMKINMKGVGTVFCVRWFTSELQHPSLIRRPPKTFLKKEISFYRMKIRFNGMKSLLFKSTKYFIYEPFTSVIKILFFFHKYAFKQVYNPHVMYILLLKLMISINTL